MTLPNPLTPPDLDLREFDWMPLDVKRLRDSDLSVLAPGDAFRAAVLLWCAAWHQVPAASLPKDERLLANFAGYGRDLKGWASVRSDAMRGFFECSDGRLYHPVVAVKAIEANEQRNAKRKRTENATNARRGGKRDVYRNDKRNDVPEDSRNEVHHTSDLDLTKPDHEKRESPLSVLDPRSEKPKPIDDSYQPSDAAIEYAYSLGMKKADLNSELSKFAADGMAKRAVSFDLDASFKKRCDQWFDYQRRNQKPKGPEAPSIEPVPLSDADWRSTVKRYKTNRSQWSRHAGPEPGMAGCRCPVQVLVDAEIDPATGYDMSASWFFVDHTTNEAAAFMHDAQARKVRPPAILKFDRDGVEKIGFFSQIQIPPGYDEATGEKLPPASEGEENAA